MTQQTPNHNLEKHDATDSPNLQGEYDRSMDILDTTLKTQVDTTSYDMTRHWGLPLYNDATPMDMRDGYNRAMRMLDQILTQLHTEIREKE